MIKRILVLFIVFFGAYNVALLLPWVQGQFWMDQGMFQQNLIRTQEYTMSRESWEVIIVGSSLAARLPASEIGPRTLNLALAGGSVLTGLRLVAEHSVAPKIVVIEGNIIMRGEDRQVLANVHRPVISQLRYFLPALREKFAPANFIALRLRQVLLMCSRAFNRIASRGPAPVGAGAATNTGTSTDDLAAVELAEQQEAASVLPDPQVLQARMEDLQKSVAALRQRGIRCVFLEMPVHEGLVNTVHATAIRSALRQAFPSSEERWLAAPPEIKYRPRDAMHLSAEEAVDFARYLRAQLAGLEAATVEQSGK